MKTFILFCRVFYSIEPEYTAEEMKVLSACDQSYEQLEQCKEAEKKVQAIKRDETYMLTSCGLVDEPKK